MLSTYSTKFYAQSKIDYPLEFAVTYYMKLSSVRTSNGNNTMLSYKIEPRNIILKRYET